MEQKQVVFVSVVLVVTALAATATIVSLRRSRRLRCQPVPEPLVAEHLVLEPQEEKPVAESPKKRRSKYFTRSQSKPKVKIIANAGAGDCMFICFRQALASLNKRVTVKEMRQKVADSVTQETFDTLKVIHDTALEDMDYDLMKDYGFMNGVNSLEQLRTRMTSRTYYGDDMALPVLEKYTGLNAVVVKSGQVQQRADPVIEGAPFIILVLENEHYQLASYAGYTVFFKYPQDIIQMLLV